MRPAPGLTQYQFRYNTGTHEPRTSGPGTKGFDSHGFTSAEQRRHCQNHRFRSRIVMAIVAGVDFGTLSVRVSIVDSVRGRIGSGSAGYPLHRRSGDPDHASQSHADHMAALVVATKNALADAGVNGA